MSPQRSAVLDAPPAESSDEDEATCSEEEEEDTEKEGSSSSEEDQTQNPKKGLSPSPLQTQTAKAAGKKSNPASQDSDSESESATETGTESDSDDGPVLNVKPIASRPMEDTSSKSAKPKSVPSVSTVASGKSNAKRGNGVESDAKETKRAKKDSESNGVVDKSEDPKKQLFQRLWSEEDEIIVLQGMIDFSEKKGIDPTKDMNSFFAFIKKSLHIDVSVSQLKDKVTRLKKRFDNHSSKGKNGEDKTCAKPHDQKLFDLSKKIWGSEGISGASGKALVKMSGKASSSANNNNSRVKNLAALKAELGVGVEESEMVDTEDVKTENHSSLKGITQFDRRVDFQGMQKYVIERGLDKVGGAKKAKMEEKWRNLHVAELEFFVKRNKLIVEQAELMLAGYKSMED